MVAIFIISIIIIFTVIFLTAMTTSKAYKFKHTIDPDPLDQETINKQTRNQ